MNHPPAPPFADGMLPMNSANLPVAPAHGEPTAHEAFDRQCNSSETATLPPGPFAADPDPVSTTTAHSATAAEASAQPEMTASHDTSTSNATSHPPTPVPESPTMLEAAEITVSAPVRPTLQPLEPIDAQPPAQSFDSPPRPMTPTKLTSSGASSPLSHISSPLSERSSFTDDAPEFSPSKRPRLASPEPEVDEPFKHHHPREPQTLIDCAFERDGKEGEGILLLRPTAEQWSDFPAMLHFARHHGAINDGCFKVILPEELRDPIPDKPKQTVSCNAYRPKRLKNNFWRVTTNPAEGSFSSSETGADFTDSTQAALQKLKKLFCKNNDRRLRDVRYRVDVPAWTSEQRRRAGVPDRSPVHPLKGDELDFSRAIIPGIHTPYVYESAAPFGATFQIHAEDFKLISLNHLYKGRKIWIVIPSTSIASAETAFQRKNKCAQFMRHRAEFIFPDKLAQLKVPHRIIDQRPGETVVILPDAYHQGFSTGYTLAEAKNYADAEWMIDEYQPCKKECGLLTAIPEVFMRGVADGEERIDLCARYDDEGNLRPLAPVEAPPTAEAPPAAPIEAPVSVPAEAPVEASVQVAMEAPVQKPAEAPIEVVEPAPKPVEVLPAIPEAPKRELELDGTTTGLGEGESKRVRVE